MREQNPSTTCTSLIKRLYRCRWARPALSVLAATPGQCRQADLAVALVARTGHLVHHRALSHAMSYLVEHGLVRRHDRPGQVTYEITPLGRALHTHLQSLERLLREHHVPDEAGCAGSRCN